jgi:hypothetical protein
VQRPLATVIVGGMLVVPILLLVIVPTLGTDFLRIKVIAEPRTVPADDSAQTYTKAHKRSLIIPNLVPGMQVQKCESSQPPRWSGQAPAQHRGSVANNDNWY